MQSHSAKQHNVQLQNPFLKMKNIYTFWLHANYCWGLLLLPRYFGHGICLLAWVQKFKFDWKWLRYRSLRWAVLICMMGLIVHCRTEASDGVWFSPQAGRDSPSRSAGPRGSRSDGQTWSRCPWWFRPGYGHSEADRWQRAARHRRWTWQTNQRHLHVLDMLWHHCNHMLWHIQ